MAGTLDLGQLSVRLGADITALTSAAQAVANTANQMQKLGQTAGDAFGKVDTAATKAAASIKQAEQATKSELAVLQQKIAIQKEVAAGTISVSEGTRRQAEAAIFAATGNRQLAQELSKARQEFDANVQAVRQQEQALQQAKAAAQAKAEAEARAAQAVKNAQTAVVSETAALQREAQIIQQGIAAGQSAVQIRQRLAVAAKEAELRERGLGDASQKLAQDFARATAEAQKQQQALKGQENAQTRLGAGIVSTRNALGAFGVVVSIGAALRLGKEAIQAADSFTLLKARVGIASEGLGDASANFQTLFNIAQKTGSSLEAPVTLFQRLGFAADQLGATNGQILQVVETVQKLGSIGGGSVESINAGIIQLAQGLGSGRVQGEELRSVFEQLPGVAKALTRELGLTANQIRTLAAEGKITGRDIFEALLRASQDANEQFEKIPATFSRGLQQASNAITVLIGELNQSTGITGFLAREMQRVAKGAENAARFIREAREEQEAAARAAAPAERAGLVAREQELVATIPTLSNRPEFFGLVEGAADRARRDLDLVRKNILALSTVFEPFTLALKVAGEETDVTFDRIFLAGTQAAQTSSAIGLLRDNTRDLSDATQRAAALTKEETAALKQADQAAQQLAQSIASITGNFAAASFAGLERIIDEQTRLLNSSTSSTERLQINRAVSAQLENLYLDETQKFISFEEQKTQTATQEAQARLGIAQATVQARIGANEAEIGGITARLGLLAQERNSEAQQAALIQNRAQLQQQVIQGQVQAARLGAQSAQQEISAQQGLISILERRKAAIASLPNATEAERAEVQLLTQQIKAAEVGIVQAQGRVVQFNGQAQNAIRQQAAETIKTQQEQIALSLRGHEQRLQQLQDEAQARAALASVVQATIAKEQTILGAQAQRQSLVIENLKDQGAGYKEISSALTELVTLQRRQAEGELAAADAALTAAQQVLDGITSQLEAKKAYIDSLGEEGAKLIELQRQYASLQTQQTQAQAGVIQAQGQVQAATIGVQNAALAGQKAFRDLQRESARTALLSTADFKTIGQSILEGTQDLPDVFEDLGKTMGVRLVEGILFGKGQGENGIIENFNSLLGISAKGLFGQQGVGLGKTLVGGILQGSGLSGTAGSGGLFGAGGFLGIGSPANAPGNGIGPTLPGTGIFSGQIPGAGFFQQGSGIFGGSGFGLAGGAAGIGAGLFGSGPTGARVGSGVLGAAALIPGPQQPFVAGAAILASLFGSGLFNGLFGPGRIAKEKKEIEKFLEDVFDFSVPRKNIEKFRKDAEINFGAIEGSLSSLGVGFALGLDEGGIGSVKRFGNLSQAAFEKAGLSAEEAQQEVLKLAEALGFTLNGAIQDINAALGGGFADPENQLSLREYSEELKENQADILTVNDLLRGSLEIFTEFSPLVDEATLANGFLADEFLETAAAAGSVGDEVTSLAEKVRAGTIPLEEAAIQLNGIREAAGLAKLELEDFKLDAGAITKITEIVVGALNGIGDAAGSAIRDGIENGFTSAQVVENFGAQVNAILRDAVVSGFIDGFIKTALSTAALTGPLAEIAKLVADFTAGEITPEVFKSGLTAAIETARPALERLNVALGESYDVLVDILDVTGLLPEAVNQVGSSVQGLAGNLLATSIAEGLSSSEVGRAFEEGLETILRNAAIAEFVTNFQKTLFEGIDLDTLTKGSAEFELLRARIEAGDEQLKELLATLGLLPDALLTISDVAGQVLGNISIDASAIVRGVLQNSVSGFSSFLFGGEIRRVGNQGGTRLARQFGEAFRTSLAETVPAAIQDAIVNAVIQQAILAPFFEWLTKFIKAALADGILSPEEIATAINAGRQAATGAADVATQLAPLFEDIEVGSKAIQKNLEIGADAFNGIDLNPLVAQSKQIADNFNSIELPTLPPGVSPVGFANGGFVNGTGTGDSVPAMLTPGEFVLTKGQAQSVLPWLMAMESGQRLRHFAFGGAVGFGSAAGRGFGSGTGRSFGGRSGTLSPFFSGSTGGGGGFIAPETRQLIDELLNRIRSFLGQAADPVKAVREEFQALTQDLIKNRRALERAGQDVDGLLTQLAQALPERIREAVEQANQALVSGIETLRRDAQSLLTGSNSPLSAFEKTALLESQAGPLRSQFAAATTGDEQARIAQELSQVLQEQLTVSPFDRFGRDFQDLFNRNTGEIQDLASKLEDKLAAEFQKAGVTQNNTEVNLTFQVELPVGADAEEQGKKLLQGAAPILEDIIEKSVNGGKVGAAIKTKFRIT